MKVDTGQQCNNQPNKGVANVGDGGGGKGDSGGSGDDSNNRGGEDNGGNSDGNDDNDNNDDDDNDNDDCHLVFKRGLHKWITCPLLIILFKLESIAKKQSADVQAYPVEKDTIAMLNAPNNAWLVNLYIRILWDPLFGSKRNMSKMHIIVKTTLLPPILLVVQIIPHQSQAQHLSKLLKSTWVSTWSTKKQV